MTEDLDDIYRRASALDPSRPSEAVRRRVLEHAAALAAAPRPAAPRPAANRARWRPAIFGTLAAAGLAGLLVIPRVFSPHPPAKSADTDAPSMNSAPAPSPLPPPQAAARSRAITPSDEQITVPQEGVHSLAEAKSRTADASAKGASRLDATAQRRAAGRPDAAAQLGAAAQQGLLGGQTAATAQPASPPADPSAALRQAAETGDVQALRVILGTQVRIDAPDSRGRTALMLAASRGQAESVDLLLAHGADPNTADANGTTPLQAALDADRPAIVAALRHAGAR